MDYHGTVSAQVHVELDPVGPELPRGHEGLQGVLPRQLCGATMCDHFGQACLLVGPSALSHAVRAGISSPLFVIVITCLHEAVAYFRIKDAVRESAPFPQAMSPRAGR